MPWNLNSYSKEESEFIESNYMHMTDQQIADKLGISYNKVLNYLKLKKLNRKEKLDLTTFGNYKTLDGFSSYIINEYGKVANIKRGTIVKEQELKDGYMHVRMSDDKEKRRDFRVNRLVAMLYLTNDDPENKIEVDHIDGNIKNNHYSNLEWVTPQENIARKVKNRKEKGIKTPSSNRKLSENDVHVICKMLQEGKPSKEIKNYIVNNTTISEQNAYNVLSKIRTRKFWTEISKNYKF